MLEITEKKLNDVGFLRQLFLCVRQNTFGWLDTTEYVLEDFDNETKGELILVARLNQIVIGFISIWLEDNFIHHLYIDRKYQDQNIGTELLRTAIRKMTSPIRLKCLKRNFRAINFYHQSGFTEIETGFSDEGEYILFELNPSD